MLKKRKKKEKKEKKIIPCDGRGKIGLNCGPHLELSWPSDGLTLGKQVTFTEKIFVRGVALSGED